VVFESFEAEALTHETKVLKFEAKAMQILAEVRLK